MIAIDAMEKLTILTDAAKYDVACTSSGSDRAGQSGMIGNAVACGICHSFASDGRCISLLKVLYSNACIYDCSYCVNRVTNDTRRATFDPRELADLTISFYRRNYIEGLFLSSGVIKNPDYTCELMIRSIKILRQEYRFNGYIHAKAIPGTSELLINQLGMLVDRMSINIELPSQLSLAKLAPDKSKESILKPMQQIKNKIIENKDELVVYRSANKFVPAGQSTQIIIGATPETDHQILSLASSLYNKYSLRRVFYSAYMPIVSGANLPALTTPPPLLREHRLYQADFMLRMYGFKASEIVDENHPHLNPLVDPKCGWALSHIDQFPVDVNQAAREMLLRVPGIGPKSADRIIQARRGTRLTFETLKKLGVVLKRAQYFIICSGTMMNRTSLEPVRILRGLLSERSIEMINGMQMQQTSMFDLTEEELRICLSDPISSTAMTEVLRA